MCNAVNIIAHSAYKFVCEILFVIARRSRSNLNNGKKDRLLRSLRSLATTHGLSLRGAAEAISTTHGLSLRERKPEAIVTTRGLSL